MQLDDDRTPDERQTHTVLIVGTDRTLSGWGRAKGGTSYAAWACLPADADRVADWVRSRRDMARIRTVCGRWRPRGCGHAHIYPVRPGHPALSLPLP
jgi:hypothetical protein